MTARNPSPDDISGTDVDGVTVTDTDVLDRVQAVGSLSIVRGPAERLRRCGWVDEFTALARTRGAQVSVRDSGRMVLIFDTDWAGWRPGDVDADDYTDHPDARSRHPSNARGPRLVPEP